MDNIKCTDHLGKKYESIKSMCSHYGISSATFHKRIERGMSLRHALIDPVCYKRSKKIKDCYGNLYNSKAEMLEKYCISRNVFNARIHRGWSLLDALNTPVLKVSNDAIKDHEGHKFKSVSEMCRYWKVSRSYYERYKNKKSLKEILMHGERANESRKMH